MADLTGTTPADTYKGLLQVNDYTDGVDATAKYIQDGEGTNSALAISTSNVGIGTTSPDHTLMLQKDVHGEWEALRLFNYHSDVSTQGSVAINMDVRASNGQIARASIKSRESSADAPYSELGFFTSNTSSTAPSERMTIDRDGNVTPGTDDAQDIGSATKKWDDIYATNGTIQTSDRELKQDIEELSEAETRVAQACKGLLRKYRWKSSVAEKGDDARIHFGIMAQDLEAAFAAEGLDAGRYGMFIKNTWWEADRVIPAVEAVEAVEAVYDEEGNEVSPAVEAVEAQPERTELDIFNNIEDAPEGATEVTQRGVRYAELLAFIIAAI